MSDKTIIVEKDKALVSIILNRPEKLNAINYDLILELEGALNEINEMEEARVIIIKGAGRAFSSGTDLQSLGGGSIDRTRPGYRYHLSRLQGPYNRIETIEKPVIAQIHGYALGAAMELVLACDFRIAALDTQFGLPEVRYGLIPDLGGCQRLSRIVGLPKAKELVMTGRTIDGAEAEKIGLVNVAVKVEDLEREVKRWSEEFLLLPPLSVGLGKRIVDKSYDTDIHSSLDLTAQVQSMLLQTEDFMEGVRAKLEKREPFFKGK